MPIVLSKKAGGSGGGGAPSGPAGGDLAGTYPNPTIGDQGSDAGAVLVSDGAGGTEFAYPPGFELDYAQFTTAVTVSATTEPTAGTVVSLPARVYDGTMIAMIEVFCAAVSPGTGVGDAVIINLWDGGSDLGRMAVIQNPAASALALPLYSARRLTPTAASHTYHFKAWRINNNATLDGSSPRLPGFIRATVVAA